MITPEAAHDIEFVGHTDQGARGDGVQVMVARGHAYVGTRVQRGVMVTDVRDPRNPKPVNFVAMHPKSVSMHLQAAEDLLLCIQEADQRALLSQQEYYGGSNKVDSSRFGKRGEDWFGFIFRIDSFSGTPLAANSEGTLSWVEIERMGELNLWDGDRHFLPFVFGPGPTQFHGVMPYRDGRPLSWTVNFI